MEVDYRMAFPNLFIANSDTVTEEDVQFLKDHYPTNREEKSKLYDGLRRNDCKNDGVCERMQAICGKDSLACMKTAYSQLSEIQRQNHLDFCKYNIPPEEVIIFADQVRVLNEKHTGLVYNILKKNFPETPLSGVRLKSEPKYSDEDRLQLSRNEFSSCDPVEQSVADTSPLHVPIRYL